jgi:hypothetical protein
MRSWVNFGFDLRVFVLGVLFASAMLIPFLWVAWLPDLPAAFVQWRARQRLSRNQCASCGYSLAGLDSGMCPECGQTQTEPPDYIWTWHVLRRFLVLNALALILGIAGAEIHVSMDEAAFRREVEALKNSGGTGPYMRAMAWPNGTGHFRYTEANGITAED